MLNKTWISSLGLFLAFTLPLSAQFVTNTKAIPRTGKPPVIFLNGHETDCGSITFQKSFGISDQVLQANSRVSLFFNNCNFSGTPSIEKLAAFFGTYLADLTYDDGQPVPSVDVVGYSMGGLIVRSYLSGKQEAQATFNPPATIRIGKAVFIATPNFGTPIGSLSFGSDVQSDELSSGSHFLMDLNTWNQGRDDLRGIDAIALAGTGGTGLAVSPGFDDGLMALTSASLQFYQPGRTRILPLCHVASPGLLTVTGFCPPNAKGISKITAATDDTARILVSFLNGTTDWQSIGTAPEQNSFLQNGSGLMARARTAGDVRVNPSSVRVTPASGPAKDLNSTNSEIAYTDLTGAGKAVLTVNAGSSSFIQTVTLPAGGARALILKTGPRVEAVIPAAAPVFPLVIAPRMLVSIYGTGLAQSTVTLNKAAVQTSYVSDTQINALIPENAAQGLNSLTVQNGGGSHTVNVFLESAFPAVFSLDQSGNGAAAALNAQNSVIVSSTAPLHAGEYLELFLTGLGTTARRIGLDFAQVQPTVTVGGVACPVTYAGTAPGFPGLDQINCVIPAGLGKRAAPVVVTSGNRASPVTTIAVDN